MHSGVQAGSESRKTIWIGRIVSWIPALLVLMGAVMKLLMLQTVVEGMSQHGLAGHLIVPIGVIEVICAIVYLVPRTAVLGAILMTGLFGGATLANVRVGDPTYLMTLILGVMVWAGIYLRDRRLRELIPLRR